MTPPALSAALTAVSHSGIREISHEASQRPGTIRLEAGQPNFRTPAHVAEAAKLAIDEGWTFYTHAQGIVTLRERLAAKLELVNGIHTTPERIVCGPGGVGVIAAAIGALVNPGDEVLLPDPRWPNYDIALAWAGGRPVPYPCPRENGWLPDLDRLRALITSRTRMLIVNSPHNPTGAVYGAELMRELGAIAERAGLWIVSDECYDQILLDGAAVAPSMALNADPERVVAAFTFSKTYAMTGWRLGYATAAAPVIDNMTKMLESFSSGSNTIAQKAGEAALDGPQDCVAEMVSAYRRRRDLVVDLLREGGLLTTVPDGAFYALAAVGHSGLDSRAFAFRLLRERGVGVAPGTAFGRVAADAVRISLASSDQDLREGVGRLCELAADLGR
ncbi:MAG: pyridoxal phosphate-dependent aminotransferase [Candidatus Dormibacteraeota bacterium]|nr:pyridoxal phosphate-dependent aminotransferase [Candidatus Dormibacteraeota bacterium]